MTSWECNHINLCKVVFGKNSVKLNEIKIRLWQISSYPGCLWNKAITTSQFYFEWRTSSLGFLSNQKTIRIHEFCHVICITITKTVLGFSGKWLDIPYQGYNIPSSNCQNVRTGDYSWALFFHFLLSLYYCVKSISCKGEIVLSILLRVPIWRSNQDWCITTL